MSAHEDQGLSAARSALELSAAQSAYELSKTASAYEVNKDTPPSKSELSQEASYRVDDEGNRDGSQPFPPSQLDSPKQPKAPTESADTSPVSQVSDSSADGIRNINSYT